VKKGVSSLLIYTLFAIFWLILIGAFLYSPYVMNMLTRDQRSISVYVWSDMVSHEVIADFEHKTGIRVFLSYYESNDELLAKLQFTGGAGYDLIVPSHYLMKSLVNKGFLKKVDKARLPFLRDIHPFLLGNYYDPHNDYAIPYVWDVYGIGFDREFFANKQLRATWQAVFEPERVVAGWQQGERVYRVGMPNDIREVMSAASLYLYGSTDTFNAEKLHAVKQLLLKQKPFVEAYTDLVYEFLLTSKTCPIVFMPSTAVYRARRFVDWVGFMLPDEGTIFNIDSFAISSKSEKDDLVYEFLNCVFSKESLTRIYEKYGHLPARNDLLREIDLGYVGGIDFLLNTYLPKLHLSRALVSHRDLAKLWLTVKAY
jgi:spermidine/putrescine transport system substrate-binding protein